MVYHFRWQVCSKPLIPQKRYVLVVQLTRKAPASDLAANVSVVGGVCRLNRVFNTTTTIDYPQFSRWAPEIYLPLNGSIADAGPLRRTTALWANESADFVPDSPFGSGSCLRTGPDAIGLVNSGLPRSESGGYWSISEVVRNYPLPWALGFGFKHHAIPRSLNRSANGRPKIRRFGIQLNALERWTFRKPGAFMRSIDNDCDGDWQTSISTRAIVLGRTQTGKIWVDGVTRCTKLWISTPPTTPTVKVMGCDNQRPTVSRSRTS